MKEYICVKDFYIEDTKFAAKGDKVLLLPDNTTVVNTNGQQRVSNMPTIVEQKEYFIEVDRVSNSASSNEDKVNHPSHYTWLKEKCGIEVIDITRHLDFDIGNAIKYLLRAGHKKEANYTSIQKEIEDLKKAIFYINDKIRLIECGIVEKG